MRRHHEYPFPIVDNPDRWLKSHDTSTIDDLLASALVGKNKKSQLAAAGTLLAAADAITEQTGCMKRVGSSRHLSLFAGIYYSPVIFDLRQKHLLAY